MTFLSKDELVRTVREMARSRYVEFDHSSAFLFNRVPYLNPQKVIDILSRASIGSVSVHHDKSDLNKYSVISEVDEAEIFLDADVRRHLTVRAVEPLHGR